MDIKNIKKEFPIFKQKINGKPLVYLDSANSSQKPKVVIDKISNFYETNSWPNEKYPKYLNIILKCYTKLNVISLLKIIKTIEKKLGRKKSLKNSPRCCDIDIIDFKGLIVNKKNLKIPHEKCHLRNFVLYPILQINPEWVHPIIKKNVKFLINKLDQKSRIEITRLQKNVIIQT